MKDFIFCGMVALLALFPLPDAQAQTPKTVERGDSITLVAADGYQTYQWQVSSDNSAYLDLPSATAKEFRFAAQAPLYYRALATATDGSKTTLETFKITFPALTYVNAGWNLPASHGFVEVNGLPGSGITIPEGNRIDAQATYGKAGTTVNCDQVLTNWSNLNAHAVYYAYHPAATFDTRLLLTVTSGAVIQFRLRVYNPNSPATPLADSYISLKGTGVQQEVEVATVKIPTAGYYRYELECLKGNSALRNIKCWRYLTDKTGDTYTPAYLSSPSVHLGSWRSTKVGAPTGRSYDWCYQEIMIPKESDIAGTYAMSLGVLAGYMGIQCNGTNNHDVIFSMWDDGSTDQNPGLENYKKAGAVDASPDVSVTRFGNEGTGVKTFASGNFWKPGTYVQFISNARPETAVYEVVVDGVKQTITRQNTLVSAWFNAQDGKGWQYIATTRLPGTGHNFDSWYSFLENYSYTSGQMKRKAYYRNGYGHALDQKQWYHFNRVNFGHTDGGTNIGARNDYAQGKDSEDPKAFYMTTGGFTGTVTSSSSVTLNSSDAPVDTINLERLKARVDQAIAKEEAELKAAEDFRQSLYNKSSWKVVSFSSEEAQGEGTNGRAAQIIDGDDATYWHSQWMSASATYPHTFVVDMQQVQPVNGFQFTTSGGTNRRMKIVELYASNDNSNWHPIYKTDAAPDKDKYYLQLDSTVNTRYFKILIKQGWSSEVHTRLNEVEVTQPLASSTGLAKINKSALTVYPSPATSYINVVAPEEAREMVVGLYTTTGERVLTQHCYNQSAREVTTIQLPRLASGIYAVRCTTGKKSYTRRILVNQ